MGDFKNKVILREKKSHDITRIKPDCRLCVISEGKTSSLSLNYLYKVPRTTTLTKVKETEW